MPATSAVLRHAVRPLLVVMLAMAALLATQTVPVVSPAAHASTLTLRQRAVEIASWQKGKPYRFGADGPNAFDCSGLVKYVYGRLGHYLPHSALRQYGRTRHITHAEMRPGDLIFMNVNGGGTAGIDHVGVYAGHHYWWVARHSGTLVTKQYLWTNRFWVGRVRS